MKLYLRTLVFLLLFIGNTILSIAQTGTRFWFAAPDVSQQHYNNSIPLNLHITALENTHVIIMKPADSAGFVPIAFDLVAGESQQIGLDDIINVSEIEVYAQEITAANFLQNKGFLIQAYPGEITAYYELGGNTNTDIISLKAHNALGTKFWVTTQRKYKNHGYSDDFSGFVVVATENATQVTIDPNGNNLAYHGTTPFTVTLNKGQAFSVRAAGQAANQHIAGVKVTSNKKIAITIFDDSIQINDGSGNWDIFTDQLVPEELVGQEYVVLKGNVQDISDATNPYDGEAIFITPTADNTEIYINGILVAAGLPAGSCFDYVIKVHPTHVWASKPVYVNHITGLQSPTVSPFVSRELGGALLPPMDGCTGSYRVTVKRTPAINFYFNLQLAARNDTISESPRKNQVIHNFTYSVNGGPPVNLDPDHFSYMMDSAFVYYDRDKAGDSAFYNNINDGDVVSIENSMTSFHLGILQGRAASGCKYAWFSEFAENLTQAGIGGVTQPNSRVNCSLDSVQLFAGGGSSYRWRCPFNPSLAVNLSDTTVADPWFSPPGEGCYYFEVEIAGECFAPATVQLELIIFEPANPVFEFDPSFACSEVTASFTNHSDPVLNSSMRWIFENPFEQIDQDTLPLNFTRHFPANTDTLVHVYPFSLLATRPGNSCPVVKHDTIRIYPELNADFEIMIDTLAQRLDVTLTSKSTGNITELNWSSGNGEFSTLPAPVFTYNYFYGTDTVYTISLEAVSADGCIQTTHIMLPVFREHVVVLTADNLRGCSPFTSVVTAFGAEHADSVFWEVHRLDGSIDFYKDSMSLHLDLVSLSGQADSVYVVIHTCHNLEWSQTGVYVTVYPEVLAYVNSDQQQGCTPLYIRFTNLSTGADSVFWDFGNSTNSYQDNPWVTYTNTSNETKHIIFTLIASNQHGCADTATGEITVFPKLTTHIELTDIAACSSLSSVLSGAANISAGSMNWFAWYPDHSDSIVTGIDGIYMLQHENTGNTIDTIPIVLLPFSDEACYESADTFVVVYPWVMAAFDLQKAGDDYPVTITTVNQSLNAGEYLWDMGDGTTAYDENLTYSYYAENDTVYSIMLIATGGQCSDTAFGTVEVNVPTALPDVAAENGSTEIYYHHPDSRLTIRHSGVSVELSGVSIVSTTGAKMYEFSIDQVLTEGTELDISLTGLPSGQLYIVILIIDNRYVVRKISRP